MSHSIFDTVYATARREPAIELSKLGWQVRLIGKGTDARQKTDGLSLFQFHVPDIYFLRQFLFHSKVIRRILNDWADVDIILFHQTSAIWMFILKRLLAFKKKRLPTFILDTRDLPDFIPGSIRLRIRKWYYKFTYFTARFFADGQTTITQRMARLVKIPNEALLGIWPSGVNLSNFKISQSLRIWPDDHTPIQLIYIGTLVEKRNLIHLCRAVEIANSSGLAFQLLIIGNGPEKKRLEKFSHQGNNSIIVRSSVRHESIPGILSKAHVGVTSLPDATDIKYQASSPIKMFEYMAANMPILAIRSNCHTDIAGEDPYVFWADQPTSKDLLKSLQEIWKQRKNLSFLGSKAGEAAKDWTWQASAIKMSRALILGLKKDC